MFLRKIYRWADRKLGNKCPMMDDSPSPNPFLVILFSDYYNQTQESANMLHLSEASLILEDTVSRANPHVQRTQACLWISGCVSTTIYWYCTTSDGYKHNKDGDL